MLHRQESSPVDAALPQVGVQPAQALGRGVPQLGRSVGVGFQVFAVVPEILHDGPGYEFLRRGHHIIRRHDLRQLRRAGHHHEPVVVNADGVFQQCRPQLAQLARIGVAVGQLVDLRLHLPAALEYFQQRVQQRVGRLVHAQYAAALSGNLRRTDAGVVTAPKGGDILGTDHADHVLGRQSLARKAPRPAKALLSRIPRHPAFEARQVQLLRQHLQRRVQVLQLPFLHLYSLISSGNPWR